MVGRIAAEQRLLEHLLDGGFHSGAALGRELGCSRAYLWKLIERLREAGVQIDAVPGRGYKLPFPIELLRAELVSARLPGDTPALDVQVLERVESTNQWLLDQARDLHRPTLVLAEHQLSGRGRWGRQWQSSFGGGLAMSLLWPFPVREVGLGGLSLAVGVALAETLQAAGAANVGVKWPNDLLWHGRKLGGVLVEVVAEAGGPMKAVIGVGLNVCLSAHARARIDRPVTDLVSVLGAEAYRRNRLAADLGAALARTCRQFGADGFAAFRERWEPLDVLKGQRISLSLPQGDVEGTMLGLDADGALILQEAAGRRTYFTGEAQLKVRQ